MDRRPTSPQHDPLLTPIANPVKLPPVPSQKPNQYLLRDLIFTYDPARNRLLECIKHELRAEGLREDARTRLAFTTFLRADIVRRGVAAKEELAGPTDGGFDQGFAVAGEFGDGFAVGVGIVGL